MRKKGIRSNITDNDQQEIYSYMLKHFKKGVERTNWESTGHGAEPDFTFPIYSEKCESCKLDKKEIDTEIQRSKNNIEEYA